MYNIDKNLIKAKAQSYTTDELVSVMDGKKAVGLKDRIKPEYVHEIGEDTIGFIRIKCTDVSLPPYQRNINQKTVNEIKSGEFYQPLGCTVHLHERFENGMWWYTCLDGQHRTYTNPAGEMVGIVSNTFAEPIIFGMANNRKAKKNTSPEDEFHSQTFIEDSIERQIRDNVQREFGIVIERHPNHETGTPRKEWQDVSVYQWGGTLKNCYDKIHKKVSKFYQEKQTYNQDGKVKYKTVLTTTPAQVSAESMNILLDLVDVVRDTFGFDELVENNKIGSKLGVYWLRLMTDWMLIKFCNAQNGVNENSIPFGEIKLAWKNNSWAKTTRKSSAVTPIHKLTLEQWRKTADLASDKGVKKAKGKMGNLLEYIYNGYIVMNKQGA